MVQMKPEGAAAAAAAHTSPMKWEETVWPEPSNSISSAVKVQADRTGSLLPARFCWWQLFSQFGPSLSPALLSRLWQINKKWQYSVLCGNYWACRSKPGAVPCNGLAFYQTGLRRRPAGPAALWVRLRLCSAVGGPGRQYMLFS